MLSYVTLDIKGYEGAPVPHTFIRQATTEHLAILFPGLGYRATMPVLYYPEQLLIENGADVLRVEYAYDQHAEFKTRSDDERQRWFMSDAVAAAEAGLAQRHYTQITLIGKSIGTQALGQLLETRPAFHSARYVWLTPLLRNARLCEQIRQGKPRSLFVIGTADSHYNPATLAELERATNGQSVVIEDANHGLEIAGDLHKSLHVIKTLLHALAHFLEVDAIR
ncbi:MAG: hypothetical protein JXA21_26960 [Anaerolineae bacterium]|nr:hypothetical protein [Anaerolineae bacterium]